MPLPEKVIEQLGREPPKTPGWAFGMLTFSGGLLALTIIIYIGLVFGYEPYLNASVTSTQDQINTLNQSIAPSDQAQIINFYSQISNLRTLLKSHILTSQFLTWLGNNTEVNVDYTGFTLTNNTTLGTNQITLTAEAKTEADVNQQVAIFQSSPQVSSMSVSGVTVGSGGLWDFSVTLVMNPSIFLMQTQ
jgi:hypothetical protein